MSSRPLRMSAAARLIASSSCWRLSSSLAGVRRRGVRAGLAARARWNRWAVSASSSRSARATADSTPSETPRICPFSSRVYQSVLTPGGDCDFLATQSGNTALHSAGREPDLLGADPGAAGGQEVADGGPIRVAAGVRPSTVRRASPAVEGCACTPSDSTCRAPRRKGRATVWSIREQLLTTMPAHMAVNAAPRVIPQI
ncbi:hypothetical protein [Mycobacterium marinum]|uniref:hypothetical protein n=1 Tax=Mycobacterium marinum TaxID=1781 RepID=UPI0035654A27